MIHLGASYSYTQADGEDDSLEANFASTLVLEWT